VSRTVRTVRRRVGRAVAVLVVDVDVDVDVGVGADVGPTGGWS